MYDEQHAVITPEIRSILPMKVFCIEVGEKYKDELRYKLIWNRLTNYAKQHNEEKLNYKFVSLSMDDPSITPMNKCRFYLGVTIDATENDSQPGVMEVPGGRYAVFSSRLARRWHNRGARPWRPRYDSLVMESSQRDISDERDARRPDGRDELDKSNSPATRPKRNRRDKRDNGIDMLNGPLPGKILRFAIPWR